MEVAQVNYASCDILSECDDMSGATRLRDSGKTSRADRVTSAGSGGDSNMDRGTVVSTLDQTPSRPSLTRTAFPSRCCVGRWSTGKSSTICAVLRSASTQTISRHSRRSPATHASTTFQSSGPKQIARRFTASAATNGQSRTLATRRAEPSVTARRATTRVVRHGEPKTLRDTGRYGACRKLGALHSGVTA